MAFHRFISMVLYVECRIDPCISASSTRRRRYTVQTVSSEHPRPSQRYGGREGIAARRVPADMDTNEEL